MVRFQLEKHNFIKKSGTSMGEIRAYLEELRISPSWFAEGTVINFDYATLYSHLPIWPLEEITVNFPVDEWEDISI